MMDVSSVIRLHMIVTSVFLAVSFYRHFGSNTFMKQTAMLERPTRQRLWVAYGQQPMKNLILPTP